MSVRIVRTRNGEDIICDLYEVTTKEKPEDPVAFQLKHPYNVWLEGVDKPRVLIETDAEPEVQKLPDPEIHFRPWVPLSTTKSIMIKMDEVVSAYETYPEVIKKYNQLVEADSGRGNATATDQSDLIETKEGVPVGESDGTGRGAKLIN
tara:strand:- start:1671 stop:2117 length:447 start_codon:yes stop_codon:yes gene_type:complete